jgi:hypothetical protein
MIKKMGGPVTVAGKRASSKNATKHGALSRSFVNEEERQAFLSLTNDLIKYYASDHPLVEMQIERIVRIKVQLDRVQQIVDALFRMSRQPDKVIDNLISILEMDKFEQTLLGECLIGKMEHEELINNIRMKISLELLNLLRPEIKSQKDFFEQSPGFCSHLLSQALELGISIEELIEVALPRTQIASAENIRKMRIEFLKVDGENLKSDSIIEEKISKSSLDALKKAASLYWHEIHRVAKATNKAIIFKSLRETEEQATMPDLDQLDRLMRYQTTLQRQLSTAMGELLALTGNKT